MRKIITLVCLCVLPFTYMAAEGYQVNSQSAKQSGMGHVGVAMKLGAESMHFNPAGLGFMENTLDLSAGVFAIFPDAKYSNGSYSHKTEKKASTPLYFYGAFKIYDFLSAGISVTNPYGSAIDWGKNWAGASLIQDISLKSFSIQPTLSWKVTDNFSIGAGAMLVFGNFELSRSLLSGDYLNEKMAPLGAAVPQVAQILDAFKGTQVAATTLSGNAPIRMGINFGLMWDITDKWTLGASYRSKVRMKVNEGTAEMIYANEAMLQQLIQIATAATGSNPIPIPPLNKGTFKAELPLPDNYHVGLTYKANDRWLFSGEVQFVGWGAYKTLNVQFTEEVLEGGYSINAPKEYKNTRIYRLGTQFAATSRLDLRFGAYLDETPVKDDYLNPETPSMNKLGITAGLSFRPVDRLSVDFGFGYITGFGRDGSYTDALTGNKFEGHYEVTALSPTIGAAYRF